MHDLVPCPASTLHPILHPRGLGSCGTTPSPQNPHRSPLHAHLAGPAPCAALQRPSGPDLGHPVQRRLPLAAQLVHGRHSTGLGHPRYATRLPRVVSILGRVCWCWRLLTLRGRWEGGGVPDVTSATGGPVLFGPAPFVGMRAGAAWPPHSGLGCLLPSTWKHSVASVSPAFQHPPDAGDDSFVSFV